MNHLTVAAVSHANTTLGGPSHGGSIPHSPLRPTGVSRWSRAQSTAPTVGYAPGLMACKVDRNGSTIPATFTVSFVRLESSPGLTTTGGDTGIILLTATSQ